MRVARWAYLLDEDPDFRRWYDNLARGSEATAVERARVLYRFLRIHDLSPRVLVDLAKKDRRRVEDVLSDFVGKLLKEGKSPGYVENYLKAVRSWLEYNEIKLVRRIKIGNRNLTPTIEDERVPTPAELRTIYCYAGERAKCSIALIAFAGLRPQTLGNASGTDGLTVKDLPDMRIEGNNIVFTKVPTMVVVRPSLSKARHKYFTFLTSEGCEYLQAYLEKRLAMGQELTPESPIIAVTPGFEKMGKSPRNRGSKFITTKNVTREIREAMRPRFKWRPYVLRAYFDTQLLVAENHGEISHAYRQFFMGHKGDIEAKYTTNKGRLPEDLIEDMRRSFRDCEEYLSTRPSSREEDPEVTTIRTMVESGVLDLSKPNVRRYLVKKLGIEDVEGKVAKMKEEGLGEGEAYARVVCGELGIKPMKIEASNKKDPKKIVGEGELELYLAEGWDVQTVLPSGKILVRKG
ncbi:site-specific integrase [Candidatus Bathyarchaeota archaeon]|nr:MAG: site-specific integrase [Candidatus Bathyarchaeota archaeon]